MPRYRRGRIRRCCARPPAQRRPSCTGPTASALTARRRPTTSRKRSGTCTRRRAETVMRPVRLQINGFTCFKDEVCLSFDNLERFVICGPTGAGKSSLLEAILFALYGEVPRTSKHGLKDLISHGRDRLSVVLDFRTGDQLHRVTRKKFANPKRAAEAQLERFDGEKFVPLTDQVRNVDAELLRLLGLGFQAFTQAVFLPQ